MMKKYKKPSLDTRGLLMTRKFVASDHHSGYIATRDNSYYIVHSYLPFGINAHLLRTLHSHQL